LMALPLAILGLLDDFYSLAASLRYGFQLVTAVVICLVTPLISLTLNHIPVFLMLVFAVTAVINFTNFMDGMDGLVASCMSILIISAAFILSLPSSIWSLLGALLAFLAWNWNPAKVFMGDVGSTFLGAVFAVLVLQASNWRDSLSLFLVATPLLGDACLCVLRRFFAGQSVFQAHRLHLFQRLHQAGWPHARVSLTYISATTLLALAMFTGGLPLELSLAVAVMLLGVWLDQRVAVPFAVSSTS